MRTDVYCLGVILYELLTGWRPFHGVGAMVLARIIDDDPLAPRRLDDTIPRNLETICLKCLAKTPKPDTGTARALRDDLRHFWRVGRYSRGPCQGGRCFQMVGAGRAQPRWRFFASPRRWPCSRVAVRFGSSAAVCSNDTSGRAGDADLVRREAKSTRRHLYAVEVDRASDAFHASQVELARQISTASGRGTARKTYAGSNGTISGTNATAIGCCSATKRGSTTWPSLPTARCSPQPAATARSGSGTPRD